MSIIYKLRIKTVYDFQVKQVALPDRNMLQMISKVSDDYWLNATSSNDTAFFAHNDIKNGELRLKLLTALQTETKGIRPVLYFTSSEVQFGDELLIDNYLFRIINDGIAVCETIADYSAFDIPNKKQNKGRPTFYQTLKKWETPAKVYKVEKKELYHIENTLFTMLSSQEAGDRGCGVIETGVPYWTKHRKDEYTGYYVAPHGKRRSSDILKKKYICPIVYFSLEENMQKDLQVLNLFAYEGRVYRIISSREHFVALCLNPISEKTCYSTGIQEYTTFTNEEEFYKNAEVCEKIKFWREKEEDIKKYI